MSGRKTHSISVGCLAAGILSGAMAALVVSNAAFGQVTGMVEADVGVQENNPDEHFGTTDRFWGDQSPAKHAFLRVRVTGIGVEDEVGTALLRLTVADTDGAASGSGGRIYKISDCDWSELEMSWNTQPVIDGVVLDEKGAVQHGDIVGFDVTSAINADGVYCFALDSASSDGVTYFSRESLVGSPAVEITPPGPIVPVCGDGVLNQPSEECDGSDDVACPGACLSDCTCAVCGDGLAERPVETCDGSDDAACPGECQSDCTCPGPSVNEDTFACLAGGADIILSGTFTEEYYTASLAPDTVIDARDATFIHCSQPDPKSPCDSNTYPVNLGPVEGTGVCWAGGLISGANRLDATWSEMHDPNNAGFAFENGQATVDGIRMHNVGDGIRPRGGAENFVIKDVWLSYIRDDCVENDHMNAGLVDDSLFDGCFVGFSARHTSESVAGPDNVWTIRNTLVRLEVMPGPPEGGDYGHKGFFKWVSWGDANSRSPKLALYNNIFMAEEQGQFDAERMGVPPGKLVDCANNTMVWLGSGSYPAQLPDCFTVTTDRSVWDDAVAEWIARHTDTGCSSETDCYDANPCTTDSCDPTSHMCSHSALPDGASCTGGLCCAGECSVPVCSSGIDCDDGDACTMDSCQDAGTCTAMCTTAWPVCGEVDCCCGPDCDSSNDPDCHAPICGDGVCEGSGEDCFSCSLDCRCAGGKKCSGCCGDGVCGGAGEDMENCSVDCDPAFVPPLESCCGDGVCEGNEDASNCVIDCAACTTDVDCDDLDGCTIDVCSVSTCYNMPIDCDDGNACTADGCSGGECLNAPIVPCCGDGTCDGGENACSCSADCGAPPSAEANCTDGLDEDCDGGTDCNDLDCTDDPACSSGSSCADGVCEGHGEDCFTCPGDCRCTGKNCGNACCGDGVCLGENASNCPVDCG